MKRFSVPALALLLAACGSTTYELKVRPAASLTGFGRGEVRDVRVELQHPVEDGWKEAAVRDAGWIAEELRTRIADEELFTGAGAALIVEPRLLRYEAEWTPTKVWGGGGSMANATVLLELRLLDGGGVELARAEARGHSVKRGWGLASTNAARRRAVDAAMEFLWACVSP